MKHKLTQRAHRYHTIHWLVSCMDIWKRKLVQRHEIQQHVKERCQRRDQEMKRLVCVEVELTEYCSHIEYFMNNNNRYRFGRSLL